ncbi:MAG: hypothetical protein GY711_25970 [bacterium]|nr:hypothetical protein [bacterium]
MNVRGATLGIFIVLAMLVIARSIRDAQDAGAGLRILDVSYPAARAGASGAVTSSGLMGEKASPAYQGLLWATSNATPGEVNLPYWDGDLSDLPGTSGDGVTPLHFNDVGTSVCTPMIPRAVPATSASAPATTSVATTS